MGFIARAIDAAERAPLPDAVTRAGIEFLVSRTRRKLFETPEADELRFVEAMAAMPVAVHADAANAQHYEVPTSLFQHTLGPRMKYSCCLYTHDGATLAEAEEAALAQSCAHAGLVDGMEILELGCGWGSLTLWMAEKYPGARILAISNSRTQRAHILEQARLRGLSNVEVETLDMNDFAAERRFDGRFDRIVSVEMFEHMSNWRALLTRARACLKPDGRMFLHVFTHRSRSYRFDTSDKADWIAQHFFTGGVMPAQDLAGRFPDLFEVENEWRWSGAHYQRTALDWLANFDAHTREVDEILRATYGADWALWRRRWRLFYLATAGLFGHAGGDVWGVGHYLLKPAT